MVVVEQNLLLSDLVARNREVVPIHYVRPISERPNLEEVIASDKSDIPIVDLQGIDGPGRTSVVEAIGLACQSDGFFQVKNHGISEELMVNMICVCRKFFRLPESERINKYSDSPLKANRLSTSFNVNTEKVGCWRDYLRLHCHPLEDFVDEWPTNPPSFRDVATEYSKKIRELALKLLGCISESLGLDKDSMEKSLGKHAQHMAINYYPPCSDPQLTYGLPAHKDPNAITLLLQDSVPGLQVLKNGKWVAVNPIPNMVINIGDQIQVLSNGRYKSVIHRAIVNRDKERISIPTFYCPSMDSVIQPHKSLVNRQHTNLYRTFTKIPRSMPSSSTLIFHTRRGHETNIPPPATSDFIVRDTGNCSPRYMRCTVNQIPCSGDLLSTSAMNLSLLVQPFALPHPSEEPIQDLTMKHQEATIAI